MRCRGCQPKCGVRWMGSKIPLGPSAMDVLWLCLDYLLFSRALESCIGWAKLKVQSIAWGTIETRRCLWVLWSYWHNDSFSRCLCLLRSLPHAVSDDLVASILVFTGSSAKRARHDIIRHLPRIRIADNRSTFHWHRTFANHNRATTTGDSDRHICWIGKCRNTIR